MTNELSTERAIEALYTVRAYYASLTTGYPKGKDCRGIGDVMCNEIANSCLMAINTLEQQLCDDCISRQAVDDAIYDYSRSCDVNYEQIMEFIDKLPSVTPQRPKGKWIYKMQVMNNPYTYKCSVCKGWEKDKTKYCPNCGAEMGGADETN